MRTKARKIRDVPGIHYITKPVSPASILETESSDNANHIREICKEIAGLGNKFLEEKKQPFRFDASLLDHMDDVKICSGNTGRIKYLQKLNAARQQGTKLSPIITSLMMEIAVEALAIFREMRNNSKSIINFKKDAQAGKTTDSQHHSILICVANTLETGRYTYPLVLLTKDMDLEQQVKESWQRISGFWGLLGFGLVGEKPREFETFFHHWLDNGTDLNEFWLRRTASAKNKKYFLKILANAVSKGHHLLISKDECDVGNGKDSVISSWFKEEFAEGKHFFQELRNKTSHITLLNYSASIDSYWCLQDYAHNYEIPTEDNYTSWEQVEKITLTDFAKKYDVPELNFLGETCSGPHSPYTNIKNFIKVWYTKDSIGNTRERKAFELLYKWTKYELDNMQKMLHVEEKHQWYKEEFVPSTFASLAYSRLVYNNESKMKGIVIRYNNSNENTMPLIKRIREYIDKKDILVMPWTSRTDAIGNEPFVSKGKSFKDALDSFYEMNDVSFNSVPFMVFVTGKARRGAQLLDDTVQIEFTNDPSNKTAIIQANGRSGGHKYNVQLVLSDKGLREAKRYINGTSTKVSGSQMLKKRTRGRGYKQLEIERHYMNIPWLEPVWDFLDDTLLPVAKLHQETKEKKSYSYNRKWKWDKLPHLFDVLTLDMVKRIEDNHEKIFITDDGKPKFGAPPQFLRWNCSSEEQPLSTFKTNTGKEERYDCYTDPNKEKGTKRIYLPIGIRQGDASNPVRFGRTSPDKRDDGSKIQLQVHHDKDFNATKMVLRLSEECYSVTEEVPKEGSVPWHLASDREQEGWSGK